jgi:hypothetical protein
VRASNVANTRGRQRKQDFLLSVLFEICEVTRSVALGKSLSNRIFRAPSVFAFLCQNANAKSEFAYLRENIGDAMRRQFSRALGVSRGLPLDAFSSPILCGKAKNGHQKPYRERVPQAQCERP